MTIRDEFQIEGVDASKAGRIAEGFSTLLTNIEEIVPPSRERSLVITGLQECFYWACLGTSKAR